MRFKTNDEMIASRGNTWRTLFPGWTEEMEFLLGMLLPDELALGLEEYEHVVAEINSKVLEGSALYIIVSRWMVIDDTYTISWIRKKMYNITASVLAKENSSDLIVRAYREIV